MIGLSLSKDYNRSICNNQSERGMEMKSSRKRLFNILLAVMVLGFVSLACLSSTSGDEEAAPGEVKVNSFKLYIDDGSGEPGDEVSAFKPTDRIQHFEVNLDSMLKNGTVIKWVFTAVDTSAGQDIAITEVETTVLIGNNLTAQLEMDQDFPTGSYRADVYIDGTLLQGFEYKVQ
jgi:hypothetical protein